MSMGNGLVYGGAVAWATSEPGCKSKGCLHLGHTSSRITCDQQVTSKT